MHQSRCQCLNAVALCQWLFHFYAFSSVVFSVSVFMLGRRKRLRRIYWQFGLIIGHCLLVVRIVYSYNSLFTVRTRTTHTASLLRWPPMHVFSPFYFYFLSKQSITVCLCECVCVCRCDDAWRNYVASASRYSLFAVSWIRGEIKTNVETAAPYGGGARSSYHGTCTNAMTENCQRLRSIWESAENKGIREWARAHTMYGSAMNHEHFIVTHRTNQTHKCNSNKHSAPASLSLSGVRFIPYLMLFVLTGFF